MQIRPASLTLSFTLLATLTIAANPKRMIAHSWDLLWARPADVAHNLAAFEALPLDGVSLAVKTNDTNGAVASFQSIMTDPRWNRDLLAHQLPYIKKCGSGSLKHNFLIAYWAPAKRLAWNDDNAWEQFAHNMRVLAWLAKAGDAKGLMVDHEDYPETRQFYRLPHEPPYQQMTQIARKRGAQIMHAMAAEYPEITLLSFWLLSLDSAIINDPDPLAAAAYLNDLWPAFLNGMMDALPPQARLVDGNEHGYLYRAEHNDFYLAAWRLQNKAIALVAPENRTTYRNQLLTGFGLYLDAYINPPDSPWHFEELEGSRLNRMRYNFEQAINASSEYVWVYGEKLSWINWADKKPSPHPTWDEKLPGFNSVLAYLKNPTTWADKKISAGLHNKTLANALKNGSCTPDPDTTNPETLAKTPPPGWWSWQKENTRHGTFGSDTTTGRSDTLSLASRGSEHGCFGSGVPVKPGQLYAIEIFAREPTAAATVSWQFNDEWRWKIPSRTIRFAPQPDTPWQRAHSLIRIPEGADQLVLLLNVKNAPDQTTWFDDISIYLIPEP